MLVGLRDGVKDWVGKGVLAAIQVIVSSEFSVDVVSLYCVEMCQPQRGTWTYQLTATSSPPEYIKHI